MKWQFEISDLDEAFQVGDMESSEPENFIPVQEEGEENLSGFPCTAEIFLPGRKV